MCSGCSKNAKFSVTILRGIRSDRDASLHWTMVTQAAVKLELQATSLPCKVISWYFDGNAQPEQHSNVENSYHQTYFETVDTVANCIVEHFNQKNHIMYANCDQVHLKRTLGEFVSQNVDQLCQFHTEFNSNTL